MVREQLAPSQENSELLNADVTTRISIDSESSIPVSFSNRGYKLWRNNVTDVTSFAGGERHEQCEKVCRMTDIYLPGIYPARSRMRKKELHLHLSSTVFQLQHFSNTIIDYNTSSFLETSNIYF